MRANANLVRLEPSGNIMAPSARNAAGLFPNSKRNVTTFAKHAPGQMTRSAGLMKCGGSMTNKWASKMHMHNCSCGQAAICTANPCPIRGREAEATWICDECAEEVRELMREVQATIEK
jgi:hypothetical protein